MALFRVAELLGKSTDGLEDFAKVAVEAKTHPTRVDRRFPNTNQINNCWFVPRWRSTFGSAFHSSKPLFWDELEAVRIAALMLACWFCAVAPLCFCRTAFNEYQLCVDKRGKDDKLCLQRGRDYGTLCPQKYVSHSIRRNHALQLSGREGPSEEESVHALIANPMLTWHRRFPTIAAPEQHMPSQLHRCREPLSSWSTLFRCRCSCGCCYCSCCCCLCLRLLSSAADGAVEGAGVRRQVHVRWQGLCRRGVSAAAPSNSQMCRLP